MKKLLFSVIAMMVAVTSFAQNALVASLSHGETVTYYYGANAFKQAVEAAASGDIINLSGGSFNAADITKAITIRGIGIDNIDPTYINGEFIMEISSTDANQFTMEGIICQNTLTLKGTFSNPYFIKSNFYEIVGTNENDAITNIMIVNCKTRSIGVKGNSSVYLVNSYFGISYRTESASITATNCVIESYLGNGRTDFASFYNCIFYAPAYSEASISGTGQATNCISTFVNIGNYASNIFHGSCNNCTHGVESVFKDINTFELKDDIKNTFKGTDGTEVGIYGGLQPYNSKPSYPLITTMNVDSSTDESGQLSVTIGINE